MEQWSLGRAGCATDKSNGRKTKILLPGDQAPAGLEHFGIDVDVEPSRRAAAFGGRCAPLKRGVLHWLGHPGRQAGLLLATLVPLLVVIWLVTHQRIDLERRETQAAEVRGNENLALAHEERSLRLLTTLDQLLLWMRDETGRTGRIADLPPDLTRLGLPAATVVISGVLDVNGKITELATGQDPDRYDVGDLARAFAASDDTIFIGRARKDERGNRWMMPLVRKFRGRNGAWAGAVFMAIDPRLFVDFYDKANLAPDMLLDLVGLDGFSRARRQENLIESDGDWRALDLIRRQSEQPAASYLTTTQPDGVERFVSFRTLPGYPLMVVVGSSSAVAMKAFDERRLRYLFRAVAASLITLLFGAALFMVMRRMQRLLVLHADSEARFKALAELSADWYWETDREHRFTLMSAGVGFGTGFRPEDYLGLRRWEVPDAQPVDGDWAAYQAMLDRCEAFRDMGNCRRDVDGKLQYSKISGTPVFNAAGEFTGYRGVGRMVTAEREAARTLAESQARLEAIIDSSMDAIITVDEAFRIRVFNAAAARMFLCTPEDALGSPIARFVPRRYADHHDQKMRLFSDTGESQRRMGLAADVLALRSDGSEFPAEATISRMQVGGRSYSTVFLRDVTDRMLAEAALRDSEEHYRLLFESSMDAVLLGAPDGSITAANSAACGMFGLTAEQFFARGMIGIADLADPRMEQLVRASADAPGFVLGHAAFLRNDGTRFEGEVSYTVYVDHAGRAMTSVVIRDVSERLAAEAERRGLEEKLREVQKMEALGTLAGGVAHDFNNILAAILGNVALARQDAQASPRVQRSLEEIQQAGMRARNLVQQILAFSRRQPQVFEIQPLRPVVEDALRLLQSTLPSGIDLVTRLTPTSLSVRADAGQVGQVLLNLCTNAWHALDPARPGTIEVVLESTALDAESAARKGLLVAGVYAQLTVRDNGTGMDPETMTRIFEPFYTTKPVGEGTGLGLAVVHGIVRAHEGAVQVSSNLGEGTRFDVFLPVVDSDAADPPQQPGAEAPSDQPGMGQGRHVAYIDDYEAMAFLVSEILKELGYRVSCFERAEDGLAAIRAHPADFDIVVTDFNMPGHSGLDLARELRALRPDLPVIITTGFITDALLSGAKECGVRLVFDKQNLVEELPGHIARVLDGPVA
ncbi:MAG: hypothetical protein CVU30_03365 [Betaproteobacteria bacterium HGW-Betaproteobacteria-3]|jgi:PAS domain S-box-containing protein|nr:MAG: hypothetical protein CVU30_03365 [Betaproteobacteria bacterium HGW-Betaproteobacteria-3]